MTNKQLEKKVLMGLLGLTMATFGPSMYQPSVTEASALSLSEQYNQDVRNFAAQNAHLVLDEKSSGMSRAEKEQLLHELQKEVAQAQADLGQKNSASSASSSNRSSSTTTSSSNAKKTDGTATEEGPSDFLTRVHQILDSYGKQDVQEEKSSGSSAGTAAPSTTTTTSAGTSASTPAAKPAATPPAQNERKFSFDWRGTPLQQTLYTVAKVSGKGIIINGSLSGAVFGSLHNATFSQVLNYLSSTFNFNWMLDGDNLIVGTDSTMMQSAVLPVSFANKAKVVEEFKSLGIANAYANSETGTISITGTPYQIAEAKKRLSIIDHPVSQCLLVAQLIEIDHGRDLNLGFQYSLPTYSHEAETSSGSSSGGSDGGSSSSSSLKGPWLDKLTFSASVEASRALSKGKVIAGPMVMSLNGEAGKVVFGDQVPILSQTSTTTATNVTVEYKDVGTTLTVTPIINEASDDITLKVSTEVSNIVSWMTSGQTRAPQIATRQATTSAHLRSGQSLVIGGLMSSKDLDNLNGIPGLMNLPILGNLFRYHSRSRSYAEVYVMITPYIVSDKVDPRQLMREVKSVKQYTGGEDYYGSDNRNAEQSGY